MTSKPTHILGIDWGTSNRRAYLLDRDGQLLAEHEDGQGMLAVGTLEPRKNLPRLVAAYATLDDELQRRHPLVVVGALGWETGETLAALRALETAAQTGELSGETGLFVYPGFRFRVVDRLLTNFHLPRSTLLMLVSAFAGKDRIFRAYRHAIEKRYRFFSYGDAMLIER